MTAEERVERVRMALAEAGYPDVLVVAVRDDIGIDASAAPADVRWRAYAVTGLAESCWPCFEAAGGMRRRSTNDCTHDPLTSPWPEVVR